MGRSSAGGSGGMTAGPAARTAGSRGDGGWGTSGPGRTGKTGDGFGPSSVLRATSVVLAGLSPDSTTARVTPTAATAMAIGATIFQFTPPLASAFFRAADFDLAAGFFFLAGLSSSSSSRMRLRGRGWSSSSTTSGSPSTASTAASSSGSPRSGTKAVLHLGHGSDLPASARARTRARVCSLRRRTARQAGHVSCSGDIFALSRWEIESERSRHIGSRRRAFVKAWVALPSKFTAGRATVRRSPRRSSRALGRLGGPRPARPPAKSFSTFVASVDADPLQHDDGLKRPQRFAGWLGRVEVGEQVGDPLLDLGRRRLR